MKFIRRFWIWIWLFRVPDGQRSVFDVVVWWEFRRLAYNVLVGAVGLVSLLVFFLAINAAGVLKPGEDAVEPLALLFAPFAVNLCYCAGGCGEIILRVFFPSKQPILGPLLFKVGLGFSVFVVSFPALFWSFYRLLQLGGAI